MAKKIPPIVKIIRNYKPEPINFGYQKNISYSQLSMFRSCPQKWALQYKEGNKRQSPSIHTVFGTAFHEVLQYYLDVMYEQSGAAADREDLEELLEEKLSTVQDKCKKIVVDIENSKALIEEARQHNNKMSRREAAGIFCQNT